jgi:hypothetical protein
MKKYIYIVLVTLAVAGSSCKKGYLDLSTNPNTPSSASPNLLLSGALKTTAGFVNGSAYTMYNGWGGTISQSTGYQPFVTFEEYQITTSTYDLWTTPYLNLSNYSAMASSTTEPYFQAIAIIMEAYVYEGLVDNYNNVPYSAALKGTANLNPTYTSGASIYASLLKNLDNAISLIQKAPATALNPTSSDIVYGGNMTDWAKFANTLKLRLAIRQSNNSALTSSLQTEIASTNSVGYIDATNPAEANPGYTNSDANGGQQSPLWLWYGFSATNTAEGGKAEYQANSFKANYLGANNDPRLIRIYQPTTGALPAGAVMIANTAANSYPDATGKVQTVVSTSFGDGQPPSYSVNGGASVGLVPSYAGPGILQSPSMNAILFSSEESLFLQAEAVKDGYNLGVGTTAQQFYNTAVETSFVNLNAQAYVNGAALSPTASADLLLAPGAAYAYPVGGGDAAQEQAIITQKWIALSWWGAFEAFNEERRTGYPNPPLSIYQGVNAPNQITRIPYPFVEYQTNAANVAAQGTINIFSSKIFWAK